MQQAVTFTALGLIGRYQDSFEFETYSNHVDALQQDRTAFRPPQGDDLEPSGNFTNSSY